ncbi:hypothetical protein [Microbacterium oxydans]|uniref:hypothetical protein n=1 Tax=Microbacterium oxydans TaxID=82380 RepID=UPI0024ADE3EE|nr:hypothetical protein [Microbacterium oxydans]
MRRLLSASARAIGSGRFLTPWSFAVTFPLSLTVMAPTGDGIRLGDALPAMAATWLCFTAALAGVAALERGVRSRRARRSVVIVGIVLCAALRPVLQDAWVEASGLPTPAAIQIPSRIATNILVWVLVLSIVALLESALRSLRRTNELLRTVAVELTRARDDASTFASEARQLLERAGASLEAAIAHVDPTSAGVRRLGDEQFRQWSHRFAELAETTRASRSRGAEHPGREDNALARSSQRRGALRLPPAGIVALIYVVSILPYAVRTRSLPDLLVGIAALAAGSMLADLLPRRRWTARIPGADSSLFVLLSVVVGVALAALAAGQGVPPLFAAISAIAYAGFALAAARCAGLLHTLRCERRRLASAVAEAQHVTRAGIRPTRDALRAAADLLHADAQGACVLFALAHPIPCPDEIEHLHADLAAVVRRLPETFMDARDHGTQVSLMSLVDTWGRVMDLHLDVDDGTGEALRKDPQVARDCYDVIAEGLLNAAKHAGAPRARVSLRQVQTGAGPQIRVRVSSPGALALDAQLRPSSRMLELGARLVSDPNGVSLEAAFALTVPAVVVSAEHRP